MKELLEKAVDFLMENVFSDDRKTMRALSAWWLIKGGVACFVLAFLLTVLGRRLM